LLKEAWNPEQAAMGNSTLPTVSDKLNVMASIHNRKLIAALSKELKEKDVEIQALRETITSLENKLNELSVQTKRSEDKNSSS
jgi:septal ring factor EnvC (AmiA/AmiB activator)